MADFETKRIINLPAESAPESGDVFAIDNESSGTKKLAVSYFTQEINKRIAKPDQNPNGEAGQTLRSNGDGTVEWGNAGLPTDEQTQSAVNEWLSEHPEATTTVRDGAITEAKLSDALKLKTIKDYVTPEMFGAVGDGVTDDADAIQNAIDNSPNKTILFANKYNVSKTIVTPAEENKKVFLSLNSGAVIKASENFIGNFVVDIGGSGNRTSIYDTLYITGIDGGTIDTNGVCGGVLVERTQMAKITNLSIINVGAYVGFRIDKPSEENNVNSSDAYVENLIVTGKNSNVAECTGIVLNGHDNDIRNIRTNFVNIGIVINGSHNRISNAHPLRGASDTENNYSVYETSRAFIINNNQTYLIDCYSDNFAVGIEVKAGCIFFAYGFTLLWYESYNVTHTFIKIVDDGETLASTKLFWGHVYGADLLFKSVGINTGIDGDFLEASYARNSNCFSELYINNMATLGATDPLLDRRFNTNKIIDYNYDPVTIDSLDQIGEGTSGRVNFSAEASPTGVAAIYIFSCTGDSTRKQITVISPSNNVVYTNIYNGSWGQWKTYQFNNGFTTPESTDAITDLSTIRCGEMGRARFAAAVSPTGQAGVFIYECIGGDESRKILIAYFPSSKNRYINSYTGSWTGWETM